MITVLGATGYVGQQFATELKHRKHDFKLLSRSQWDYTDHDTLYKYLKLHKPSFVINCAGYTGKPNVDACEVNKLECLQGNAILPETINTVCSSLNIPWGHVSSGCIYTGTKEGKVGFTEEDEPNFSFDHLPCSWYSGTKALGEKEIKGGDNYIWRLRIPFDQFNSPRNYLTKILTYSKVYNNVNSVSHRGDFVKACLDLYELKAPYGIYNVVNTGEITTEYVVNMTKELLKLDRKFEYWSSDEEFYAVAAKTPRSNCVLSNEKLIKAGVCIRSTNEALIDALTNWVP